MQPISAPLLQATFWGFNTLFQSAMGTVTPSALQLATSVPSSGQQNVYAHMSKLLRMRRWLGERLIQNISSKAYSLKNRKFELTVSVDRDLIEDDQLGTYSPMMSEMGSQTGLWMHDQLVLALKCGAANYAGDGNTEASVIAEYNAAATTYDGVPFFSASHPIDPDGVLPGVQSNKLVATDLTTNDYENARIQMFNMLGSDNRPLGLMPGLLVVPPQLEKKARDVVAANLIAVAVTGSPGGAAAITNTLQGTATVLVLPELQDQPTVWYLMDVSRSIKPLLAQVRRAPEFVQYTSPDSPSIFNRNEFLFGSFARGAAGYGLWFLALRAAPSGV